MRNFSIVIPLYNKSRYIQTALNSILNQTYKNYEVIIVDDGSLDESVGVVKKWFECLDPLCKNKFKLVEQNNGGVSVARNTGIVNSANEYIAFLDADDYWETNHLANLAELVNNFENHVDIFSAAVKQKIDGSIVFPKLGKYEKFVGICSYLDVSSISNGFVHSSSVCVNRKVLSTYGFPVGMKNCEDIITWARLAGNKGLAFNSERTSVNVVDNAEASLNIDLANYLKYGHILKNVNMPLIKVQKHLFKYYLFHFMFARLHMDVRAYFKQYKSVMWRSNLASLFYVVALLTPRWIISKMRDVRKIK